jgi:predicted O-linked N-acetylglucosamine transferase (SPINDLY family)
VKTSKSLDKAFDAAIQKNRAGRLRDAENLCRHVLEQQPQHSGALHLLGVVAGRMARHKEAVELISLAVALNPSSADYYDDLGLALVRVGRVDAAIDAHRRAVVLNPHHPQASFNLGNLLQNQGRVDESIAAYRQDLKVRPKSAETLHNLGCALKKKGLVQEAEACVRRALAIQSDMPEAHNTLGAMLLAKGELDAATSEFNAALQHRPGYAEAYSNLGASLRLQGRLDAAIAASQKAIELMPDLAEAYNNLGIALREKGMLTESMDAYKKALRLQDRADVYNNLGNAYKDAGQLDEAIRCFERAVSLAPADAAIHSNWIYTLQFHPEYDAAALFQAERGWNEKHAKPLARFIRPHRNDPDPGRRLRIGYVSPYFHLQAESFFVVPLLEAHDHEKFEIHCYASVIHPDHITERIRKSADVWHDALACKDAELAEQIRRDGIDVLIDLAMHMAQNRLPMFARKPAPVQVAWLAYPGGTGLDAMDYRITDWFIDPEGQDTPFYAEKSIRLPDCWCCYDPLGDIPPAAPRAQGPIRFGSINNPCKVNEPLLRLWSQVLRTVADSRLLVQTVSTIQRNQIRDILGSLGVSADRLEFVPRCPRIDYLRLYDRVDICLDPLPYNGVTTTCDALWMGVPVVTLAGKTAAGRAGWSILANLGLSDLVAQTPEQFVHIASHLALDMPKLTQLQLTLQERVQQSPLMDYERFARHMEAAYRKIWQRWCAHQK